MSDLNIYQRMSAITNELQRVAKNLNVGTGKSTYKAVGEADILDAVKPIEVANGVYSYPISRNIIDSGTIENESIDWNTKEKLKKSQLFMRVETVYRFVNMDKPEEFIETTTYGDGVDSQDKAPGKAMTYADKYALMKAYKITTGDDPDQNPSGDLNKVTTKNAQGNKPTTTQPEQPNTEEDENKLIDKVKIATIQAELKRTGVPATQITNRYKIFEIKELTITMFTDAMRILGKMPDKKPVDLGL